MSASSKWILIVAPAVVIVLLVGLNFQAIFERFLVELVSLSIVGNKVGMVVNLFGVAIPDQIVPDFHLGFSQPPVTDTFYTQFTHTLKDALWTSTGFGISAVVLLGIWRSRAKFLPEILYFLAPLAILAIMLPSTPRYLMSYQPFLWVFFYEGARILWRRFFPSGSMTGRARVLVVAACAGIVFLVAGLRWNRIAGTGADRSLAVSLVNTPRYVSEVTTTFRSLRNFVETLPADRTLLIGSRGEVGRWTAISNRLYYQPDSALVAVAGEKDVYLLLECGTIEICQAFPQWKNAVLDRLCRFDEFKYDSVFAVRTKGARAEVLRMRPST